MPDLSEKWPILANWKFFFVLILPVLLIPLLVIEDFTDIDKDGIPEATTKFRCAYVIILMALYWMVEALPLAITSFMPVVLFPLFGVVSTSNVAINYMKETNMMFIGGLMIALAVEFSNLHKRIALRVMTLIGSSPIRIMLGVMLTTMFLSMWISNTATTAMMVPIVLAILDELNKTNDVKNEDAAVARIKKDDGNPVDATFVQTEVDIEDASYKGSSNNIVSMSERHSYENAIDGPSSYSDKAVVIDDQQEACRRRDEYISKRHLLTGVLVAANIGGAFLPFSNSPSLIFYHMLTARSGTARWEQFKIDQKKMYLFATAYSSNIGGTGVVTGTAPNLVLMQIIKDEHVGQNGKYLDLTFATWMGYAVPTMLINVTIAWGYLILTYFGIPDGIAFWRRKKNPSAREEEKQKNKRVQDLLDREYANLGSMTFHEAAVALLFFFVVMLWFFRDPRFIDGWALQFPLQEVDDSTAAMFVVFLLFVIPKDPGFLFGRPQKQQGALLDWKYVQSHLPWGVVLLMGGGFAISDAAEKSHLSIWIGEQLNGLKSLPDEVILITCMVLTAAVTEVASNAATASVIVPILIELSKRLDLHPLYLTLPSVICCSFAFMLPVATPPNAIVYAAAEEEMKIIDMVKVGAFLNVSCTVVLFLMHISYGNLLFSFNDYVYESDAVNSTMFS